MLEDKNYRIVKMHIGSFERKNGLLTFDRNKYPERLCVHDKENKFVIDVATYHKYPYIRVVNMQELYNKEDVKKLTPQKRVACMEYATITHDLKKEDLEHCKKIIKLLQSGKIFIDARKCSKN